MPIQPETLCLVWDRYSQRLGVIARGLGQGSEDAMQEAFVELAKQPQLPEDPLAWLVRVMRNRMFDRFRSEKRRKAREQKYVEAREADAPWTTRAVSQGLIENESIQRLTESFRSLSHSQREVLVLHVWGEMTFSQIAEATGKSTSACHREYKAALKVIAERLGPDGGDDRTDTPNPSSSLLN
ncbi:MAG: sigma-70 family RNA polymerase sigma factor [Planctomycetota bacterium]